MPSDKDTSARASTRELPSLSIVKSWDKLFAEFRKKGWIKCSKTEAVGSISCGFCSHTLLENVKSSWEQDRAAALSLLCPQRSNEGSASAVATKSRSTAKVASSEGHHWLFCSAINMRDKVCDAITSLPQTRPVGCGVHLRYLGPKGEPESPARKTRSAGRPAASSPRASTTHAAAQSAEIAYAVEITSTPALGIRKRKKQANPTTSLNIPATSTGQNIAQSSKRPRLPASNSPFALQFHPLPSPSGPHSRIDVTMDPALFAVYRGAFSRLTDYQINTAYEQQDGQIHKTTQQLVEWCNLVRQQQRDAASPPQPSHPPTTGEAKSQPKHSVSEWRAPVQHSTASAPASSLPTGTTQTQQRATDSPTAEQQLPAQQPASAERHRSSPVIIDDSSPEPEEDWKTTDFFNQIRNGAGQPLQLGAIVGPAFESAGIMTVKDLGLFNADLFRDYLEEKAPAELEECYHPLIEEHVEKWLREDSVLPGSQQQAEGLAGFLDSLLNGLGQSEVVGLMGKLGFKDEKMLVGYKRAHWDSLVARRTWSTDALPAYKKWILQNVIAKRLP